MDKEILPQQDRLDWFKHIGVIDRGKEQMIDFHKSLTEIRNRKLWRMKYGSWDEFCRLHLDYTGRRGNQVIAGCKLIIALPAPEKAEKGTRVPATEPENERQARELSRLGDDPKAQSEAFAEAVELAGGEQPTVKQLRQVVNARLNQTPPDGLGRLVTIAGLRGSFLSRGYLKKATSHLTACTKLLKTVFAGREGAQQLTHAKTTQKIGYARTEITAAMPYVVCSDCEGVRSDACERCTGRGWLTQGETTT